MSTENTLGLMQLSDSFFPTGSYTMSHGLEILHRKKIITNSDQISELILTMLSNQVGPADCVALSNAYDHIQSGNLRALGVTAKRPLAVLPRLRPLADTALPGFEAAGLVAALAPAK